MEIGVILETLLLFPPICVALHSLWVEVKYLFKCRALSHALHRLSKRNYYGSAWRWSDAEEISIWWLKVRVMCGTFRTIQSWIFVWFFHVRPCFFRGFLMVAALPSPIKKRQQLIYQIMLLKMYWDVFLYFEIKFLKWDLFKLYA